MSNYELNWNNLYENLLHYTKISDNKANFLFVGKT